jgi:hypothetical protein
VVVVSTSDVLATQLLEFGVKALARIEAGVIRLENDVATIQELLTALGGAVAGVESDVQRLLTALADENVSPETQQAADALKTRLDALNSAMDQAVPPPTP